MSVLYTLKIACDNFFVEIFWLNTFETCASDFIYNFIQWNTQDLVLIIFLFSLPIIKRNQGVINKNKLQVLLNNTKFLPC